ncbi:4'-phosphopantetheinyl transferase superfamily protein [Nonomuraea sp. NPDC049750]|uniref:4'-phosphopantetheinyl transferase superfamily protein n=1 Tax=Nonomuraea sp. NPDC049750 TaxID=3154738 RepID=UPI0033FAC87D
MSAAPAEDAPGVLPSETQTALSVPAEKQAALSVPAETQAALSVPAGTRAALSVPAGTRAALSVPAGTRAALSVPAGTRAVRPGAPAVSVWWARVADARDSLAALLDPAERARYEEYRRPADRARFLTAAALLRLVVGRMLDVAPELVPLDRSCDRCGRPHGRPRLPPGTGAPSTSWASTPVLSVSHAGDSLVVAVGVGVEAVGVDVEAIDHTLDIGELVGVALTDRETRALDALDPPSRASAFLRLWTRKEAVLKALGVGLDHAPDQVDVLGTGEPVRVMTEQGEATLLSLNPPRGYHASLAVIRGPVPIVECDGTGLLAGGTQKEHIW